MTTDWKSLIADVPDFPKPGIVFKDITPLLASGPAFQALIAELAEVVAPLRPTQIAGIESRGFIFGAALAHHLGVGLELIRKPGKLPRRTIAETYALEYGTDTVEIHADGLGAADRVVIVDDVLATGGTAAAAARLVEKAGGQLVGLAFIMELGFLGGRAKLPQDQPVFAMHTIG
ncbi:MAG: adenine phosphoribosyltransferase [Myxococcales bacterium]|nr:adenine phosphoribosyltransferase [Myxococcales bacterium]MCB9733790.1 adenine phosphoribosyltransferase [Deltaproteobacteria bacterium]